MITGKARTESNKSSEEHDDQSKADPLGAVDQHGAQPGYTRSRGIFACQSRQNTRRWPS
jgi:hypothetical protein